MLTVTIVINEREAEGVGPARKVDLQIRAEGCASRAEVELFEQVIRPRLDEIAFTQGKYVVAQDLKSPQGN